MKHIVLLLFVTFLLSSNLKSQVSDTQYPFQSVFVGYSYFQGYEKFGDAFKNKSVSTNPLMRRADIPSVGISHHFNSKLTGYLKVGYGFIKSDNFDTILNIVSTSCERKIRDLKFDVEISYLLINSKKIGVGISGELGYNFITEKYSCFGDKKYNNVGLGAGATFYYGQGEHKPYAFSLFIYKIGDNKFLGGSFKIPVFSNRND